MFAAFKRGAQGEESGHCVRIADGGRSGGKVMLDGGLQLASSHGITSLSRQGSGIRDQEGWM
jgi:hypothetical protein